MVYVADEQTMISPPRGGGAAVELDRLGDEIAELAAHMHAATYQLLVRLRMFDEQGGWGGGFRSCAHWLSWRTSIGLGTAREHVRVARALGELPRLSEAMRRGQLSFAKIRALTRIATPSNEKRLLELARQGTASHIEKVVRAWRRVDRLEGQRRADAIGLIAESVLRHGFAAGTRAEDDENVTLQAETGVAEEGDLATEANLAEQIPAKPSAASTSAIEQGVTSNGQRSPGAARSTRSKRASTIGRADRFQVVVHADAEALRADSDAGHSVFTSGIRVPAETSRRLACDASRVVMAHDAEGNVLGVGRRTRTIPPAIRRALDHRDRGCRFPGCGLRYCDAHHITHWADGGETRLDNLIMLCRRHHRAVHEQGFRVQMTDSRQIVFLLPDGRPLPEVPAVPELPDDPVASLTAAHRDSRIEIDAWTPTPGWMGERLDLDFTLLTLRGP